MLLVHFYRIIAILLLPVIKVLPQVNPYYPEPKCQTSCEVEFQHFNKTFHNNLTTSEKCKFHDDTPVCAKQTKLYTEASSGLTFLDENKIFDFEHKLPSCNDDDLIVNIWPFIKHSRDLVPSVNLHIEMFVYDTSAAAISIRQRCVKDSLVSSERHDSLCLNKARPVHWGGFIWPCRMFDWSQFLKANDSDMVLRLPLKFQHNCFSAGLQFSQIRLDFVKYPKLCRCTYDYMAVQYFQMHPETPKDYAPFVLVDANNAKKLAVRFNLPDSDVGALFVLVEILHGGGVPQKIVLQSKKISLQDFLTTNITKNDLHAVYFYNIKIGSYTAVVTILTNQCHSTEYASHTRQGSYYNCPSCHVTFELQRDLRPFYDASDNMPSTFNFWLFVFAILATALCFVLFAFYRRRRRRKMALQRLAVLTFDRKPTVYVVYTDDSQQHTDCVISLAEYLRDYLNCDVMLDEWTFTHLSHDSDLCNETEWVLKCASLCDYYLILFSPGSTVTLSHCMPVNSTVVLTDESAVCQSNDSVERSIARDMPGIAQELAAMTPSDNRAILSHHQATENSANARLELTPRRRWLETFSLSIACAYQHALEETRKNPTSNLQKIICCTLDYGRCASVNSLDCVPNEFKILPCRKYRLLKDLSQLIAHLHDLPSDYVLNDAAANLGLVELTNKLDSAGSFYSSNPDWLLHRLRPSQSAPDRTEIRRILQQSANEFKNQNSKLSSSYAAFRISDFAAFEVSLEKAKISNGSVDDFPLIEVTQVADLASSPELCDLQGADFPLISMDECFDGFGPENSQLSECFTEPADSAREPLMILDYKS